MKKLLALLLALVMVFALVACGNTEEENDKTEETTTTPQETTGETEGETTEDTTEEVTEPEETVTVMTYEEFVNAELDSEVTVEFAIQGTQTYSEEYGNTSVYGADENGGYFVYRWACTADDAAKMTTGTWVRVTGFKAEFAGQLEIVDVSAYEFIEKEAYTVERTDVTAMFGTDELANYMTLPVAVEGAAVKAVEYKNGEEGNDIYLTVTIGEADYDFCVETDLTNSETDVYKTVAGLKEGDVISIEAYLYWYEGPNPHVTAVTVAE